MIDMARAVVEIAGGGRVVHEAWPPLAREIDTGSLVADVSRIGVELGWRPTTALVDGLRQTIAASVERCDS
jgi:nucleoside-diphosphate-sugar epimerase